MTISLFQSERSGRPTDGQPVSNQSVLIFNNHLPGPFKSLSSSKVWDELDWMTVGMETLEFDFFTSICFTKSFYWSIQCLQVDKIRNLEYFKKTWIVLRRLESCLGLYPVKLSCLFIFEVLLLRNYYFTTWNQKDNEFDNYKYSNKY